MSKLRKRNIKDDQIQESVVAVEKKLEKEAIFRNKSILLRQKKVECLSFDRQTINLFIYLLNLLCFR